MKVILPLKSGGAVENEFIHGKGNLGLITVGKGAKIPTSILDLSFLGTSTDGDVTYWAGFGRKCFYANKRFWVFYSDGTNIVYRTSTDGKTWSAVTTIRTCDSSHNFSVWFDGTYVHYAATETYGYNLPIVYRRGTPNSDGTITWSATEQVVRQDVNMAFRNVIIAVDSGGYPWIGMMINDQTSPPGGNGIYADVTKSSKNDGTWTTATGFPYRPDATAPGKRDIMILVPLTAQKMYITYVWSGAPASNPINGRLWDGSAWSSQETATTRQSHDASISSVAYGDIVHVVYDERTTYNIYHLKREAGTWTETSMGFIGEGTGFSLTVQQETGYLWVFYIKTNTILYRRYLTSWGAETTLQTRTGAQSPYAMNSYYQARSDGKLGVVWTEAPWYTIAHSGLYGS